MAYGGPVFGDMVGLRALQTGAAALVTDGMVRDTAALTAMGFTVYAGGTSPALIAPTMVPWAADIPSHAAACSWCPATGSSPMPTVSWCCPQHYWTNS